MGRVYLNRYSYIQILRRAVKRKKEKTFAVPRAAAEKIFSVSYCNALWKEKFTRYDPTDRRQSPVAADDPSCAAGRRPARAVLRSFHPMSLRDHHTL